MNFDPNYTHITVLLDCSISMCDRIEDTINGFNTFLAEQKTLPGRVDIKVVKFDTSTEVIYDCPLDAAADLSRSVYEARGSTALHDAIGLTISANGERFASLPAELRPGKVLVLIFTDGEENSSKRFSGERVKQMIDEQTQVYNWQFIFMGADEETALAGNQLGINNSFSYNLQTQVGVKQAYSGISNTVATYRATGMLNITQQDVK